MTPTLFGRWQTRIFLFITIGLLITIPFSVVTGENTYFWILFYVGIFGLGWDTLYNFLQKFRWDRDWIGLFQLLAGIWEGIFIFMVVDLWGLPGIEISVDIVNFTVHYSCVWIGIYTASQTFMRVFFPRWRFRGGQLF
jgi:hypothetical protein